MAVTTIDRSRQAQDRYRNAARLGLDAAATHLRVSVVRAFGSSYYKGGAFRSTLQVKQSIRHVGPTWDGSGWAATVGTNKIEALYWELGHQNVFTRKYERVELWVPTVLAERAKIQEVFATIVARVMGAA